MITDQETNFIYFSSLISTKSEYKDFWSRLELILKENKIAHELLENTRDIWCRDYMPIQITDKEFIEYKYDPDYLQAKKYRHLKTYTDIICDQINLQTTKTDLIIDGGNVIKTSNCVILTDKVIVENKPIYKREKTIEKIKLLFKVDNVIIIPWDKNEPYGHADGMIRFIDNHTVLLNGYLENYDKKFKHGLFDNLEKNNIQWKALKYNKKNENTNINWAYINYLQTKDILIIPKFDINEDEQAFEQIKEYFPNNLIKQINCTAITKKGGALNCISWNIKK